MENVLGKAAGGSQWASYLFVAPHSPQVFTFLDSVKETPMSRLIN